MLNPVKRFPDIKKHDGVWVVRDDLTPGGTKARIFLELMTRRPEAEFVYAGPAVGMAQVALAVAAYQRGKQATVFVAKRSRPTSRTIEAKDYGARIVQIAPGYLSVVRSRAETYCRERGAFLVPFGGGLENAEPISRLAVEMDMQPDNVWCAAGSGTLANALSAGWTDATVSAVEIGKKTSLGPRFRTIRSDYRYEQPCRSMPAFSADRYYEAKAWEALSREPRPKGETVFWNVAGADQ